MIINMGAERTAALLRGLIMHIPSALVVKDSHGRIVATNPCFLEWTGRTLDEVLNRRLADILPADVLELSEEYDRKLFDASTEVSVEYDRTLGDGVSRRVVVSKFRVPEVDDEGRGTGVIVKDVTEQRELQNQLRQTQKVKELGELAGGIAHDFNNILTVVLGNLEYVLDMTGDNLIAQRHLGLAQTAAHRGARLVQQLLAFSRRQQLMPSVINVNQLVGEVIELGKRLFPANIVIRGLMDAGLSYAIADPAQLESAILNLLVNARDAMPDGGTLSVTSGVARIHTVARFQCGEVGPGNYATITVSDTGQGMPQEVLSRVFEPFFTTKPSGGGTGLGLSMVQGFVEQSGGHICIDSEPGRGTHVQLYLPLAEAGDNHSDDAVAPIRNKPGSATILVVEDDADVRSYLERVLADRGYRVLAVTDGASALALLDQGEAVDLLFTDLMLPGTLNGREVAEAARQRRPGLKVLLGSGYSPDMVEGGGGSTALPTEVVAKPYTRDALTKAIDGALDGQAETHEYHRRRNRLSQEVADHLGAE